jgi:hypothetical protein
LTEIKDVVCEKGNGGISVVELETISISIEQVPRNKGAEPLEPQRLAKTI